jgi:predicted esterase
MLFIAAYSSSGKEEVMKTTILTVFFVGCVCSSALRDERLGELTNEMRRGLRSNIDPNTFTISGISAGACMVTQFQYAWSSIVKGAGIVAGAPYLCAAGSLSGALECLDFPAMTSVEILEGEAELNAKYGFIDPLEHLKPQTVFLFSGVRDSVVPQQNMKNVLLMLKYFGTARVTTFFNYSAEHAWVTDKYGNACSDLGSPYINNCGIDFAGRFLKAAFDRMQVPWNPRAGAVNVSDMYTFSQTEFGADPFTNSLGSHGYIYIPKQCLNNGTRCHLHMNFHGCTQDKDSLGPLYVLQTELNEWAESNNIVVVYPQATANALLGNPDACFDWWGYTGSAYARKNGVQVTVFREMIRKFGRF